MRNLTAREWNVVITVLAAVVAYLLVQSDVDFPPGVDVLLGAAAVALAALRPDRLAGE